MHLALITRIFNPTYGGLERFQVNLAKAFVRKGHDITVFSEKWDESLIEGLEIVPVKSSLSLFDPNSVRFAKAVREILKGYSFDCVLSNTPYYPCDIHRAGGGIHKFWYKFRAEEFGGFHKLEKYFPRYRAALKLEKNIYNPENVKFQIANSQLVKSQMITYYGFPEDKISVVYNGIDFDTFDYDWCRENRDQIRKRMNISDKDVVIFFPSNNFKRKGLSILVDAVRQSQFKKNLLVLAVGRDKGLFSDINIKVEGHQEDILPYYAASDCMILPTMYEPCSNVVLEAMACGIPPVTSPTNGASEFIEHEKNGFVMNSWKDVKHLKQIIEGLFKKQKKTVAMGRYAVDSVKGLTLEQNADSIFELCRQVIADKNSDK